MGFLHLNCLRYLRREHRVRAVDKALGRTDSERSALRPDSTDTGVSPLRGGFSVRLWSGPRRCHKHRRVPLDHLIFVVFFLMSFLLPCPSPKCLSLYSFTLANPSLFQ